MTAAERELPDGTAVVLSLADAPESRFLLGNKAANLVTMIKLGIPVPQGFVISLDAFQEYRHSQELPTDRIEGAFSTLCAVVGKDFNSGLEVSVRSSAPVSMPGMMDTVLNVNSRPAILDAVRRVFDSWDNPRAVEYRRLNQISYQMGTAAIVQMMVYGNKDEQSGTGVIFTRNPNTGERGIFGEYMMLAQGEALVSGIMTPRPIAGLRTQLPQVYAGLETAASKLEMHFRDMQDIEFTFESGKLYILQTRSGKRASQAAIRIARDLAREGIISKQGALLRVSAGEIGTLLQKRVTDNEGFKPLARGLAAAPGAATGVVVFDPVEARTLYKTNQDIILVRLETTPDDLNGVASSAGLLTSRGGQTSHAAIIARAMRKPCVCGAEDVRVDLESQQFTVGSLVVRKLDTITIDGNTGNIYLGAVPLAEPTASSESLDLIDWADVAKRLGVRANADTLESVAEARRLGAESIGLYRTERHYTSNEKLELIKRLLLKEPEEAGSETIQQLLTLEKESFIPLFQELRGMPIVVRLLDMPLHEFIRSENNPTSPQAISHLPEDDDSGTSRGHLGVRLSVAYPEIYKAQIDAIIAAKKEVNANVSIIVPQVITLQELLWVKQYITDQSVKIGVMMETVRACMRAGRLAEVADFISFNTNDLTQAVYSFSREDAERKFLPKYLELGVLHINPFEVLDVKGVGRLMETAIYWVRQVKPSIEIGVCGEHAGEPNSIKYFHKIGIDYISCNPVRVPVAKMAAAQAAIEEKRSNHQGAMENLTEINHD
jgi:pyruvate,orthophosphate dikinase